MGDAQVEGAVQGPHCKLHVLLVDHHRDLDLTGGDHINIDALPRQLRLDEGAALAGAVGLPDFAGAQDAAPAGDTMTVGSPAETDRIVSVSGTRSWISGQMARSFTRFRSLMISAP